VKKRVGVKTRRGGNKKTLNLGKGRVQNKLTGKIGGETGARLTTGEMGFDPGEGGRSGATFNQKGSMVGFKTRENQKKC